jgi:hypothetical protein
MPLKIDKLANSTFQFSLQDPFHSTDVLVQLPDLTKVRYTVWGDWGPMYTFHLDPNDQVLISYNSQSRRLDQNILLVESPVVAKEREQYPFYVLVEDKKLQLKIFLYLNPNLKLGKVVVQRMTDRAVLYEAFPPANSSLRNV